LTYFQGDYNPHQIVSLFHLYRLRPTDGKAISKFDDQTFSNGGGANTAYTVGSKCASK